MARLPKPLLDIARRGEKLVRDRDAKGRAAGRPRAGEGARHLEELKHQALVAFGSLLPLGPEAIFKFMALQPRLREGTGQGEADATDVLDLLLRLSEGVGSSSGYARSLRGAARVFVAKGFENARIEDILKAGDVSPRTFYQFFRNKNEVLAAHSELFLTVVFELMRRDLEREGSPDEKLQRFARILVGGMAVIDRMALVVVSEALRPSGPLSPLYEQFRSEVTEMLAPVLAERERLLGRPAPEAELSDVERKRWIAVRLIAVMGAVLEIRLNSHTPPAEFQKAMDVVTKILVG